MVIRLWKALEKNILLERKKRQADIYMTHFQWLYEEALQHWRERNIGKEEPNPCNELTKEIMESKRPDLYYSDVQKLKIQAELEQLKFEIAKLKNDLEIQKSKK